MSLENMSSAVRALWAKKDDKTGIAKWTPLMVHLEDTMNVGGWLWEHWMTEGEKNTIISQSTTGDPEIVGRTVRFICAVHDIGKATPAFQTQRSHSSGETLDIILLEDLENAGFQGISDLILSSPKATHHSLAGEYILNIFGVKDDIASIIGSHHGKPIDSKSLDGNISAYRANYYQSEDENSDIYKLWHQTQYEILNWALVESEIMQIDNLPSFSRPAQVLLSGLLIMADWIASGEEYFPLLPLEYNKLEVDINNRFNKGLGKWYKNLPIDFEYSGDAYDIYSKRFGFSPRDFQKVIYDTVEGIIDPGIIIIEAPTGGGKTEAALATAEQLMEKTGRNGIFFGLPTQATSNGIFKRIESWVSELAHEYGNDASLRLVHGKAALNKDMENLPRSTHISEDESEAGEIFVNEWFSGRKKTALDDFVVGTVDNFLLTALKQKHLALRHLGFEKKIVIIDEVHAYDAYMQSYLSEAIRWMGAYGVPVVLLSATLPADKRSEFIEAYLRGKGCKIKTEVDFSKANLMSQKYPLLTYSDGNAVRQNDNFEEDEGKQVKVEKINEEELIEKIGELYSNGGIIGVIVNTVKRSQDLAKLCIDKYGVESVELLHSNFIATDRIDKEQELLQTIGKGTARPGRKIIIGTQVIEQSLDIDFDVILTDLCPMDLLIQRIGRLQRHDIKRLAYYIEPKVYIIGTSDGLTFESGSSKIYGDYLLSRTQYFLPEIINVPHDVSDLVQNVYSNCEVDFTGENLKRYEEAKKEFEAGIEKEKSKAKGFMLGSPSLKIKPDAEKYTLIGLLKDPDKSHTEEKSYAQVRDIKETVEVIALKWYGDSYGLLSPESEEDKELSRHISEDSICMKIATQSLRLPYRVCLMCKGAGNLIDKLEHYNREHLANWQSQPWLKGTLGIIFDESGKFTLDGISLKYDNKYGLTVSQSEEENEQI